MAFAVEQLPPGFRFHPTDEEIIIYYLLNKVIDTSFDPLAIAEVDLNNSEPWDLPHKAKMGENQWFFFSKKDRKYATGIRTNRATKSGYWKSTGKDKEIYNKNWLLGMKKTLVFHTGRAPKGERTNWVIHEYRLVGDLSKYKEEWVICRVFQKKTGSEASSEGSRSSVDYSYANDHFWNNSHISLPPLVDCSFSTNSTHHQEDELKATSEFMLNNINQIQMLQHHHYSNFHRDSLNANAILHPQNFHQGVDEPYSRLINAPDTNIGGDDPEKMCKMKIFPYNNSIFTHSHDSNKTAIFVHSKKPSDQQFESLSFNPSSISDLDSFWS